MANRLPIRLCRGSVKQELTSAAGNHVRINWWRRTGWT